MDVYYTYIYMHCRAVKSPVIEVVLMENWWKLAVCKWVIYPFPWLYTCKSFSFFSPWASSHRQCARHFASWARNSHHLGCAVLCRAGAIQGAPSRKSRTGQIMEMLSTAFNFKSIVLTWTSDNTPSRLQAMTDGPRTIAIIHHNPICSQSYCQ